jgi:hypothetical protein
MSALERIADSLSRRDEVPNQQLAKELAANNDVEGVREIAEHLWDKNTNIQSDCLKVMYELGMIRPDLVGSYHADFIKMIRQRNNRLVWGAMIGLTTIAAIKADELYPEVDRIKSAIKEGSVITVDNGIKTLALIGSKNPEYRKAIFPYLLEHLKTCRPKDVPQHAEHVSVAADSDNRAAFVKVLNERISDLSPTGLVRVKKIIKKLAME